MTVRQSERMLCPQCIRLHFVVLIPTLTSRFVCIFCGFCSMKEIQWFLTLKWNAHTPYWKYLIILYIYNSLENYKIIFIIEFPFFLLNLPDSAWVYVVLNLFSFFFVVQYYFSLMYCPKIVCMPIHTLKFNI